MAVALQAKATSFTDQGNNTSPFTLTNITVGGTATLLIGVYSSHNTSSAGVPTAMTWGGTAMTLLGHAISSDGLECDYVYGLLNPAAGALTLSCSFSPATGGAFPGNYLDAYAFSGTDTNSLSNAVRQVIQDNSQPAGTVYPTTAFSLTTVAGDMGFAVNSNTQDPNGYMTAVSPGVIEEFGGGTQDYATMIQAATGTTTSMQFGGGAGTSPNNTAGVCIRIAQPGLPYAGPGDLANNSYFAWHGFRAYSGAQALAGAKSFKVVDGSNANATDIVCLSGGEVDVASLNTWIGLHGTPHLATVYDQVNGYDMVQTTVANMATVVVGISGLGTGQVAADFTSGTAYYTATFNTAPANQPFMLSCVAIRKSVVTYAMMMQGDGQNIQFRYENTSGAGELYAGSSLTFAPTENVWHTFAAVANGGSSAIYMDGASVASGAGGANGLATFNPLGISDPSLNFTGYMAEWGWLQNASGFSAGDAASLNLNQQYWFYPIPGAAAAPAPVRGLLLPRSAPGIGPRARHFKLLNSAAPIIVAPPPITGGNLPTMGVG